MTEDYPYSRVYWHSRRGMLELDLVLMPFVENVYRDLDEVDQERYRYLLTSEDQDLFAWFLKRVVPEDVEKALIVEKILKYAAERELKP
jgi:antitoxin CptB